MTVPPLPSPHRGLRLLALATGLGAALAAPAHTQDPVPPRTAAESRAALEQACRDEGEDAAMCSCLGDFVAQHFSERELAGAALVFADPLLKSDPGAAIATLLSAGYSLEEITAVAERVASLEEEAEQACALDDGAGGGD